MKSWNGTQRQFIYDHLGTDMTGDELGQLFMVNPAEIYLAFRARHKRLPGVGHLTALHTPGGGNLLKRLGRRGATLADEYQPMDHDEFQRMYRPPGYVRP